LILALLLAALLAQASPQQPAAREQPRDWSLLVGAGAAVAPKYQGSSSVRVLPLPLLEASYGDRFFASVLGGVGVNLLALPDVHLGVALAPEFGRSEGSDARLSGWGHIGPGAAARAFAEVRFGPLRGLASVKHELGAANGTLADLGVSMAVPLHRRLILSVGSTVTWGDGRYMRGYFGIDDAQLAAARNDNVATTVFRPGPGFRDVATTLAAIVILDQHWSVRTSVRGGVLLGDAAKSPVAQQTLQLGFGSVVAYRFR
jgi:outer membrane scaffolding protein for murein synthesis (MipA/OmpV family)